MSKTNSPLSLRQILENNVNGQIVDEKSGASGVVFIVDYGENSYPRKTAYKTFQERFQLNDEKIAHFIEECERWFLVTTSYIAQPFYAKVLNGQPFICMPFFDTDLQTLMLDKEFNETEALIISCQLVKGMIALHAKNMGQHQDYNPPNILLKNINTDYPDYPSANLLNYDCKIADFGTMDIYNKLGPTLGARGGKYPFKAPEQYDESEYTPDQYSRKKYKTFCPDIFALGILIYMLTEGKHPNGLSTQKALKRNTSKSLFINWVFRSPKVKMRYQELEDLINQCLEEDPDKRPDLALILDLCLKLLESIDKNAFDNLKLRFDYKDKFDRFQTHPNYLHTLGRIAELPGKRTNVLNELKELLLIYKREINTESLVIRYCDTLLRYLSMSKRTDTEIDFLIEELDFILQLLSKEYKNLKVHHKYPSENDKGEFVMKSPSGMFDFEVPCLYFSNAIQALEKIKGEQAALDKVKQIDDDGIWSMFYYHKAEFFRNKNIFETVKYLNLAKQYNPHERLFDYMISLWIGHNFIYPGMTISESQRKMLNELVSQAEARLAQPE